MLPIDHYREAERLVAQLADPDFMREAIDDMTDVRALYANNIAIAQVHATLAQASVHILDLDKDSK